MSQIYYQHFGAFYSITETFQGEPGDWRNGQPILYGAPRMHYIKCCEGVYYIRFAKDLNDKLLTIDTKGEFLCDFTLASADSQALAMAYMQSGDKSGMHPVTQAIVGMDEYNEMGREDVLTLRGGIMTAEFMGFVPNHVFMVRPDLAGVTVTEFDGEMIEVPVFDGGSWYLLDNPEFL